MPNTPESPISALPEAILGHVLALAGVGAGSHVTLVCKAWRHAFYAEPALWSRLDLSHDVWQLPAGERRLCLQNRQRLLCRVAPRVRRLLIKLDAWAVFGWSLPGLLERLPPGQLTALHAIHWGSHDGEALAGLSDQLRRFSYLTSLELSGECIDLPAGLTQLRSLRVHTHTCQLSTVAAILQATQLTWLAIEAASPIPLAHQLSRLSRLAHLHLSEVEQESYAAEPAGSGPPAPSFPVPSTLAALRSFDYHRAPMWGSLKFEGGRLHSCHFGQPADDTHSDRKLGRNTLSLASPLGVVDLDTLIASLLPAGMPLERISLDCAGLAAYNLPTCNRLAWLPALRLVGETDALAEPANQALLSRAHKLTELCLTGFGRDCESSLAAPPAWLADRPGLASLDLSANRLSQLPGGRYLEGLTRLDLGHNLFEQLPPAVAAATSLRSLSVAHNSLSDLPEGPIWAGLEVLDLSVNPLAHLPPALAGATALRRLLLCGGCLAPLTLADAEAVLARLPALEELVFSRDGMEERAEAWVERCLPHLGLVQR